MSGANYTYVQPQGVIFVNTGSVLAEVQTEWIDAFGTGLNTDASTPQGVMITAETLARSNVIQNNVAVANQINPNQAAGVFLDVICALTGLEREANTYSIANNVTLAGVPGSPIAAGSSATTPNNDVFTLENAVTLSSGGSAIGTFVASLPGPVATPTGAWTPSAVLGWETVTNGTAGTLGTATQSDEALRALRRQTLALQGRSLMDAILSELNDIPNVIGTQGIENYTGTVSVINGVTLQPHSLWVCVDGGTAAQIGSAMLNTKSIGCDMNGGQTIEVTDTYSGRVYPIIYDIPTLVPVLVRVTCSQGSFVGDITAAIVKAVVDFGNNAIEGLQGFQVGISVSSFEIATAIMSECVGLYISLVEITLASSVSYSPNAIPLFAYQKATVTGSSVSVVLT